MKTKLLIFFTLIGLGSYQLTAQEKYTNASGDGLWGTLGNWVNTVGGAPSTSLPTSTDRATLKSTDGINLGGITRTVGSLYFNQNTATTASNGTLVLDGSSDDFIISNWTNKRSQLTCDVTVNVTGKSFKNRNAANSKLRFLTGTVALGTNLVYIDNKKLEFPIEFDGIVTGATTSEINIINGNNGGIDLGSSSDFSGFTGSISTLNNPISSDCPTVFLNAAATLTLDGTGLLTVNVANTIEGSITRSATTAGAAEVVFNADQTNMAALTVDTNPLALDFDASVTEVRFSSIGAMTGIVDLKNYESGVLIIDTTVSQAILDTWTLDGIAQDPGTIEQRSSGAITSVECTVATDVTALDASTFGAEYIDLSWTFSECYDEVLVVAKETTAVTAVPSGDGTSYTADTAFGFGTEIGTDEFVVYKGTDTSVTINGLTKDGTTYHFKVFSRKGSDWSGGVVVIQTTNNTYTTITGGNSDGLAWETASTWLGESIPSAATDDVVIDAGTTINSDIEANDVTNNARITINPGFSLKVNDVPTVTQLIVNTTSASFGSLIVNGTINGTIIYNRFIATNPTNDLVSPPVSGITFGVFAVSSQNENRLYRNPLDDTQYLVGPFNNQSGEFETYFTGTDDATELISGKGYRMGTNPSNPDNNLIRFTGGVVTGNVGIALTDETTSNSDTGKWNLIGNPYPSYVDFTTFFDANTAQFDTGEFQAVYGYNGAQSGSKYEVYNNLNTPPGSKIAPGQGFFVASKTGGSTQDVTFTAAMRTIGSEDDFIPGNSPTINKELAKLQLSDATSSYSTAIYFADNVTRGLDPGFDAGAFSGNAEGIYTNLVENNNGAEMAIQALPYNDFNDVVVPLGIKSDAGIELTIGLDAATATLPSNINIYLEDNATNTLTLLNTGDYVFTPTTALDTTGRFFVHFSSMALSTDQYAVNEVLIYTNQESKIVVVNGQLNTNTTAIIYDTLGREVLQQILDSSKTTNTINVNALKAGIYIVQLYSNSQSRTQKVLIK